MEKNNFLPRTAPLGDAELRDLPFSDRAPLPRMEVLPDGDGMNGGGCGCDDGDQGGVGDSVCMGHEGCGEDSWGLSEYPLAMVFAPCQHFRALYDPTTALKRGTLFTELDLPLGGTEGAFTTVGCGGRCDRSERRRV
ncbi:MAG: spore coat associated protein CotJA [Clostridia bacterium]|nr:spore coat associated protein CotJA [Clostridia bacterium]